MNDDTDADGMVIATITITRCLHDSNNPEHSDTVRVDTTGDPTLLEVLGMLEFAKMDAIDASLNGQPEDE